LPFWSARTIATGSQKTASWLATRMHEGERNAEEGPGELSGILRLRGLVLAAFAASDLYPA